MYLKNKKAIILWLAIFFLVMLLIFNCMTSNENDPNARYMDIVSEDACTKQKGYWYNNECWANVIEYNYSLAPNAVDDYVNHYLQAKVSSNIRIDGTVYPILNASFSGTEDDFFIFTSFLMNDVEYTLISLISLTGGESIGNSEEKHSTVFMLLCEKNNYDFSSKYSELQIPNKRYKEMVVAFLESAGGGLLPFAVGMGSKNVVEKKFSGKFTIDILNTNGTLELFENTSVLLDLHLSLDMTIIGEGDSTLSIEGDKAYLNGDLGIKTYLQIRDLQKHPEVKTLVLQEVPGSIYDEINVHTGRLIRTLGLNTYVPSDGKVYSGGVDLFAAGVERIIERGGKLGIHSWCCFNDFPANELVDTHPAHRSQTEYFTEVMGEKTGPAFYFRTIKAASFDDTYIMSEDEIIQSGIATNIIDPPVSQ